MMQFIKRAKYDAWSAKRGTLREDAMREYTSKANALGGDRSSTDASVLNDAHSGVASGAEGSREVEFDGKASEESAAGWKVSYVTDVQTPALNELLKCPYTSIVHS